MKFRININVILLLMMLSCSGCAEKILEETILVAEEIESIEKVLITSEPTQENKSK